MQSGIGMGPVVHAHLDCAEGNGRAFLDFSGQSIIKRLITGPFCKVIRKGSRNIPNLHGVTAAKRREDAFALQKLSRKTTEFPSVFLTKWARCVFASLFCFILIRSCTTTDLFTYCSRGFFAGSASAKFANDRIKFGDHLLPRARIFLSRARALLYRTRVCAVV